MKQKPKFKMGEVVCLYRGTADRYGKITRLLREHAWVRFRRSPLLALKVAYGFLTPQTKRERGDA